MRPIVEYGWFYDAIVADQLVAAPADSVELQTLTEIRAGMGQYFFNHPDREERLFHAWSCAARYLLPRDGIDRERLQRSIELQASADLPSSFGGEWIEEFVRTTVGQGRRHWP